MRTVHATLLTLGLVALISAPASAQGQGRGRFMGGGYAALLGNASVQKELKLDDKQIEKGKELAEKTGEEMRDKMQGLGDLEPQERRAKMMEIMSEVNASSLKTAGEFLKPEQTTRLKQVFNQQRGAMAFSDTEVAKKLNLTDAQKTDIKTIQDEANQERRAIFQDAGDDREAAMKKMAELNKTTLTKVEAKLNDEQQKTWKEMLGSPFEIKYEQN
jgi:uncharacterized membrane protein